MDCVIVECISGIECGGILMYLVNYILVIDMGDIINIDVLIEEWVIGKLCWLCF